MSVSTNQVVKTLLDVLTFMKPFAGGTVPDETSEEYLEWVSWVQIRQEEYAKRGFWRRLLSRKSIVLDGETIALPDNFHKHNGLYVLDVNGVDWAESENQDNMTVFVEMETDSTEAAFGDWQLRLSQSVSNVDAILWYFANPPKPDSPTDIVLLPGDLLGYGALIDYYRQANQEGSMDKAEEDAENRFITYLSLEMIPPKYELLSFSTHGASRVDRLERAKSYYGRANRNTQV